MMKTINWLIRFFKLFFNAVRAMRKELGVSASNKSQGLADVVIEIKKL